MHNLILGKRNSVAQQSILATSIILANHYNIDPAVVSALKVQEKDVVVRAMKEREAVAALLEAIRMSLGLSAPVEDEPIPGVVVDTSVDAKVSLASPFAIEEMPVGSLSTDAREMDSPEGPHAAAGTPTDDAPVETEQTPKPVATKRNRKVNP